MTDIMQTVAIILLLAGLLAGAVNFFISYLGLPFPKPAASFDEEQDWPKVKTIWLAMLGYIIVGIAGAALVPLVNAMQPLKGLEVDKGAFTNPMHDYILFGYSLVFGYSTSRLLVNLLDSIIKRLSKVEFTITQHNSLLKQKSVARIQIADPQRIIEICEVCFDANKDNCSGFVEAVARQLNVQLTGLANDIVDEISGTKWTKLADGIEAKAKADEGWFVIAGLKGADNVPPQTHGHVAVIVSGPLAYGKYPTGYWGRLNSTGMKDTTINYAWNDQVGTW